MNKIHTRYATLEDISSIYELVRELAIYEKAEDQFLIDKEYYIREFNKGTFSAIVAEQESEIIGMTLYYMTYSTWKGRMLYLEDFVVKAEHRHKGVGQRLYDAFLAEAKKLDARMVKWQVLDWNEPAVKFYKKNNATIEKEWWNCKVIFN